ncbi:MAG: tyrosine-type recombinase/integrase [Planctomycetota bacterium]
MKRLFEFFTANIRNVNTRQAYAAACSRFFDWADQKGIRHLGAVEPSIVAAYIEGLQRELAAPSVKQHLAAIRMLFDWLVVGQVMPHNVAASVRGPKHVVRQGKTPILSTEQTRLLLDSLPLLKKDGSPDLAGLRDRALIGIMVFAFARVSAVTRMRVCDYFPNGKRYWLRLHEKGGKEHQLPTHHRLEGFLDEYIAAMGIGNLTEQPLFRKLRPDKAPTSVPMSRNDVLRMVKRRVAAAGLPSVTCCHSFRATGITSYLELGTLEHAQAIACHESPRTTKLYDRTGDQITLEEIERIRI